MRYARQVRRPGRQEIEDNTPDRLFGQLDMADEIVRDEFLLPENEILALSGPRLSGYVAAVVLRQRVTHFEWPCCFHPDGGGHRESEHFFLARSYRNPKAPKTIEGMRDYILNQSLYNDNRYHLYPVYNEYPDRTSRRGYEDQNFEPVGEFHCNMQDAMEMADLFCESFLKQTPYPAKTGDKRNDQNLQWLTRANWALQTDFELLETGETQVTYTGYIDLNYTGNYKVSALKSETSAATVISRAVLLGATKAIKIEREQKAVYDAQLRKL